MSGTYTTMQGDLWDAIAFREMGSASLTSALMRANLQYVDTYIFPAGVELTIPDAEEPDAGSLPPWKEAAG